VALYYYLVEYVGKLE